MLYNLFVILLSRYIGANCQLFVHFTASKIVVTWLGAPKLGLHKALISTLIASKFQLCTTSGFGITSELLPFQAKICHFLRFFVPQFTITWHRFPKIRTHNAFIYSCVPSTFQLSRFYRLLVISKINPHLPKFANKNKGPKTTRSREVPIKDRSMLFHNKVKSC